MKDSEVLTNIIHSYILVTVSIILRFSWCLESDTFKKQEDKKFKGIWIIKLIILLSTFVTAAALIYLEVHDTKDALSTTIKSFIQFQLHLCDTLVVIFFFVWIKLKVVAAEENWSSRKKKNRKMNIFNWKFLVQCTLSLITFGILICVIYLFQESRNDLTEIDAREAVQKLQCFRFENI